MTTYADVHGRVERLLLGMVDEGRASFAGASRWGPTFEVDPAELGRRMAAAGLLGDSVPWSFTLEAELRLTREADA